MTAVPPEAVTAALAAVRAHLAACDWYDDSADTRDWVMAEAARWAPVALEAAAPLIAAAAVDAEREHHLQVLRDLTRKMPAQYEQAMADGAKAERERIIRLASQLRAGFPADHPAGAQASFADYLRVTAADRR